MIKPGNRLQHVSGFQETPSMKRAKRSIRWAISKAWSLDLRQKSRRACEAKV